MVSRRSARVSGCSLVLLLGCGSSSDFSLDRARGQNAPGDAGIQLPDGYAPPVPDALDPEASASFAVLSVLPSHGPHTGGTRVEIRGRGFGSRSTVTFGATASAAADTIAASPWTLQTVTPAGEPGVVDVIVDDPVGSSRAVLRGAFTYDAFVVEPAKGASIGGTRVTLRGQGTRWTAGTTVVVDGQPCTDVAVVSSTELSCSTPRGTIGSKAVTVTTPDSDVRTVRDAFVYEDSSDGYRGGLSGAPLPGELKVLALSNAEDRTIRDAVVLVRGADGTLVTGTTDERGVVTFAAPPPAPLSVTVAKRCLSPVTFDGVEVRTVTAYLSPVLSVECIPPEGELPPQGGGYTRPISVIRGELVWKGGAEFQRARWRDVPAPVRSTQRAAAYVLLASSDPHAELSLPSSARAVTPESSGTLGYAFDLPAGPGNHVVYAIAGLEESRDDGHRSFEPFSFGMVRGVGVQLGSDTTEVMIPMEGRFTAAVDVALGEVPRGSRGPDRVRASLSVAVGDRHVLVPGGVRTELLPLGGPLRFEAVPALEGALAGARYAVGAQAVTGGAAGAPMTTLLGAKTRGVGGSLEMEPFVGMPIVKTPSPTKPWNGHTIELELRGGGADLLVIGIGGADGTASWTIAAPGDARIIELPDFSAHPEFGIRPGPLTVSVSAARLPAGFAYDSLRVSQLSRAQWTAYSYDSITAFW